MGVVLAHDLADDRGALAVRRGGREAHLAHREEDAAMDRLEAVADVGQCSRHDDAHRVVEVAGLHLVLDTDGSDLAQIVGHGALFLPEALAGPWCGADCGEFKGGQRRSRCSGGFGPAPACDAHRDSPAASP